MAKMNQFVKFNVSHSLDAHRAWWSPDDFWQGQQTVPGWSLEILNPLADFPNARETLGSKNPFKKLGIKQVYKRSPTSTNNFDSLEPWLEIAMEYVDVPTANTIEFPISSFDRLLDEGKSAYSAILFDYDLEACKVTFANFRGELESKLGLSEASISLIMKLGFLGFSEFKFVPFEVKANKNGIDWNVFP